MSIRLTTVITHFEQHADLRRCVTSVLCQTEPPEVIIIVDDGSRVAPCALSLPKRKGTEIQVYQTLSNSGGPAKPRNIGISLCTTSHIAFIDSDDQWLPSTTQAMKRVWKEHSNTIVCGDMISWTHEGGKVYLQESREGAYNCKGSGLITYKQLVRNGNHLFLSTVGGPTRVFNENQFDESQQWEDYDLWLRLCKQGEDFVHTGATHTIYRVKRGSRSGSRNARHAGCKGIMKSHLRDLAPWQWPMWYWKQRWL